MDEEEKEKTLARQRELAKENILRYRVSAALRRTRKSGKEFAMTENDLLKCLSSQNYKCFYTGIPFDNHSKLFSLSVDRKDSSKGYTPSNIHLVCSVINRMKSNLPEETFLEICAKITEIARQQGRVV